MSITVSLMFYDKNKEGNIIECGNTKYIFHYDFIPPYPIDILKELVEKFPLKSIDFYEGLGEDKNSHWKVLVLDNEKIDDILNYIENKMNEFEENSSELYNLITIKKIIDLKINKYKNDNSVMVNIDCFE